MNIAKRYIIQIDYPERRLELSKAIELLQPTGVVLDEKYRPVLVNPRLGRYVVRGTATDEARVLAESLPGIQFFTDSKVIPA